MTLEAATPAHEPVRVGVIGCGNISGQYLERARQYPILDVAACADLDPARAAAQARRFAVPRSLTVDELLADPSIELVVNLTIPAAHAEVALRAIEAGKHVYGEKPLAVTAEDGRRLLDAATKRGVRVGNAPDTFLGTSHQTCRALIDEGAIGRPLAALAFMLCPGHESWHPDPEFYYRPGGGPMLDMGPYYLTALINLVGPIRRVSGITGVQIPQRTITSQPKHGKVIDVQVPDHVSGSIEFASGVIGTIVTSFAVRHADTGPFPITIIGSEGSLGVPDPNRFDGPIRLRGRDDDGWHDAEPRHAHPNGRSLGVADMALAIREGRPHRASGDLALAVLDAMIGFETSSTEGRHHVVHVPHDRPAMLPESAAAQPTA